jgi:S-adenosylmethionine:tRNA ribosyltransferase-isomerase
MSELKTSDFSYPLPEEYIAQQPVTPRDASRLMVVNRETSKIKHAHFHEIGEYLFPDDVLIINKSRVLPARLQGRKIPTGGKVELLLLRKRERRIWEAMVGGSGLQEGKRVQIQNGPEAEVVKELEGPLRWVSFTKPVEPFLEDIGQVPLPPYIHEELEDGERYQTVYADQLGSAAAPTAGLHFTPRLMTELRAQGIQFGEVTLHIGLDTFAPVREEDPEQHTMHKEWCSLPGDTAELINRTRQAGGRVIAVGTTTVRTLETAAQKTDREGILEPFEGETDLFILPGYDFKVVDAMITNFHLPESTLLMLVCAFASRERIFDAYQVAKKKGYRFFSFGDAMFLE